MIRVVLAQAVAVESRPAAWDGDLERLLVAGDGDQVGAGIDIATLGSGWTLRLSRLSGSGGSVRASVIGELDDGREASLDAYSHPPRHPISAIVTKGKRWRDRRAAFSGGCHGTH